MCIYSCSLPRNRKGSTFQPGAGHLSSLTHPEAPICEGRASGCAACHTSDRRLVGPGYREISAKYGSDDDGFLRLVRKVKGGSQGIWGSIPMPPNPTLSDDDARAMVKFILELKAKPAGADLRE